MVGRGRGGLVTGVMGGSVVRPREGRPCGRANYPGKWPSESMLAFYRTNINAVHAVAKTNIEDRNDSRR